jgi:thioredoxin reductase
MYVDYDVIIVGGGPAGLYSGLVLKKGLPTQRPSESHRIAVFEQGKIGGLAKYGYITISKKWLFPGSQVIAAFYDEASKSGVEIYEQITVTKVVEADDNGIVKVSTDEGSYTAKYVIITSGITPNPEALSNRKILLGLGTVDRMVADIDKRKWERFILYGSDEKSLQVLKDKLKNRYDELEIFVQDNQIKDRKNTNLSWLPGISESLLDKWDGILIDYNAFKVVNGSTPLIDIKGLKTEKGYILTDQLGRTSCKNIYAAGNVSNIISGVLIALSSALTISLEVGRNLNKSIISEPDGRFPWFPREVTWEDSWLPFLESKDIAESYAVRTPTKR